MLPQPGRTAEAAFFYWLVTPTVDGRRTVSGRRASAPKRKVTGMNTHKPAGFEHWDEKDIEDLVSDFESVFDRSPSNHDLKNFRRARSAAVRLPLQTRRRIATLITSD